MKERPTNTNLPYRRRYLLPFSCWHTHTWCYPKIARKARSIHQNRKCEKYQEKLWDDHLHASSFREISHSFFLSFVRSETCHCNRYSCSSFFFMASLCLHASHSSFNHFSLRESIILLFVLSEITPSYRESAFCFHLCSSGNNKPSSGPSVLPQAISMEGVTTLEGETTPFQLLVFV